MTAIGTLPRLSVTRHGERERLEPEIFDLGNGDRVDQPTFHRWYTALTEDVKVELIDGEIFMASPVSNTHFRIDGKIHGWLDRYEARTPGVAFGANGSFALSNTAEPQPDSALIVLPEFGGRTKLVDDYCVGGPELVIEVARTSRGIELHRKKADYERAGVLEYIVVTHHDRRIFWHEFVDGKFKEIDLPDDGILRSRAFPGLWLNTSALFALDSAALAATLELGLAELEHAKFVQELETRRAAISTPT